MAAAPQLEPVYLVVGEDELKREAVCKRLVNRVAEVGDLDFNMEQFKSEGDKKDGDKGDRVVDRVIAACETLPFMSDFRLVMFHDVDKLSKDDAAKLADYVDDPVETTVLCLVATDLDGRTKLYKSVAKRSKVAVINCAPKSKKELPAFVANNMAGVYGIGLDLDAAELLIEYVGDSTVRLDAELKKLRDAFGPGVRIDRNTIARNVTRTTDMKPWDLQDALSNRDVRAVEHVLAHLPMVVIPTAQCTLTFTAMLSMLVNRIRDIMTVKALIARGEGSDASLVAALGLPRNREWTVKFYRGWAGNYRPEELRDALMRAETCERLMKSGGDPELELERWLLETCTR